MPKNLSSADGLNEQQRLFAELFCGSCKGNATQAMRDAGYEGDDASLATMGSRMLRNVKVKAYIDELNGKVRGSAVASVKEIREMLTKVMRDDPEISEEEFVLDARGNLVADPRRLTPDDIDHMRRNHGALPDDVGDIWLRMRTKKTERIAAGTTLLKMSGALIDNVQLKVEGSIKALLPLLRQHMKPESFADLLEAFAKVSAGKEGS